MRKRDKPKNLPRQIDSRGMPIIKGAKEKEKKISKSSFHIGNGVEKIFLIKKWEKTIGVNEARKKWNDLCSYLQNRYEKLIKKGIKPKEAKNKILEKFAREHDNEEEE